MTVDLSVRKPAYLLTPEDFAAFPIWEYASDEEGIEGQDETWVRPVASLVVPCQSHMHVSADFTAVSGRELCGYVTVSTLDGPPKICQGTIFYGGEALFVPNPEAFNFQMSREQLLAGLGIVECDLFPLAFRLRVSVEGETERTIGVLP